jgi:hypothetical protein
VVEAIVGLVEADATEEINVVPPGLLELLGG